MNQLQSVAERVDAQIEQIVDFLDSPAGQRLRRRIAAGLIVSVPLVMRIPGLRRTPIGRFVEIAGGATVVVKIAELIRDWERSERRVAASEHA